MSLSKEKILGPEFIADETIRKQFISDTHTSYRRCHYLAYLDSTEVGLISFILWVDPKDCLTVPRIFVHPVWRRQRIAQWLIEFADEFAIENARARIVVEPDAQDGPSTNELRCWCKRNGYVPVGNIAMEKRV